MFRKMMVATGDSPWSRNAVECAVRLATSRRQELMIAHILNDDLNDHLLASDDDATELREQLEATGHGILERAAQVAETAELPYRTVLESGDVADQIVKIANWAQCDLIVLGTRHLSGDKRLMTGRICNAVLATSPCPVLVVPLVQLGRPGRFV